ncbi:MAG TPA: B12-binding domain-containing radical SAM protein [Lachnospiraceae bacterium]|nr:B12-binding domain-containing radical SAM protein [Lachnospiraceae bacterium]
MRVLLIAVNAKYIHSNPAVYSLRAYAQAALGNQPEVGIEIAEYTINQNTENILADIYRHRPDIAAFSCYIWNWNTIQELLPELPKLLPDTKLWLGGPEVSFHAEKILAQYTQLTGIMVGEGEETFTQLVRFYHAPKGQLQDIPGLVLPQGRTQPRELTDMSKLPFLYEDLGKFQNRIIYYESQRGCPFRCAYCLSAIDKSVRLRDIETVKKELQYFLDHKVSQVKFIDRTFNCNAAHALAIWRYLLENDNGVTNFHFEIAADLMTEEELEVLKQMRPGLIQLEIGVQSTNEQTLHAINRYMSLEHLRQVVDKIHSFHNIHQHLDLIAGLPYEDYDSFVTSFNDVYAMRPQQLQLGFLKVLKGSPIEEKAEEYGIVYNSRPPYEVLYSRWIPYDDVLRLKGIEEMVELYYNSCQFTHTLPVLEKEFSSPFALYEALSQYYEEKGYYINTPARAYRYQVLLEFAQQKAPARSELYAQLLTFDMYLRENLKSRPAFALCWQQGEEEKEQVRAFYRQEAQTPQYLTGYEGYQPQQLMKMTHIEYFTYPVWQQNMKMTQLSQKTAILFDYQKRDPLTYDAAYYMVIKEENGYE